MSKGILSIYWGDESKLPIERLKASVKKLHPELPHEIIKLKVSTDGLENLNIKSSMFNLSPFEETLFLDIDTIVMGRLDLAFEKAKQFGVALSICEAPWAKRYKKIFTGDQVEYNTGVIFFSKSKSKILFDKWHELASVVDSSILSIDERGSSIMPANDQGSFALAVEQTGFNPFILPLNWNFRPFWQPSFFGPIKIWHDYADPPSYFDELSAYYSTSDAVIQHHQIHRYQK